MSLRDVNHGFYYHFLVVRDEMLPFLAVKVSFTQFKEIIRNALSDRFKVVSVFKVLTNAQTISPRLGLNSNIDPTCETRELEKTYLSGDSLNTGCYPGYQRVFLFCFRGEAAKPKQNL